MSLPAPIRAPHQRDSSFESDGGAVVAVAVAVVAGEKGASGHQSSSSSATSTSTASIRPPGSKKASLPGGADGEQKPLTHQQHHHQHQQQHGPHNNKVAHSSMSNKPLRNAGFNSSKSIVSTDLTRSRSITVTTPSVGKDGLEGDAKDLGIKKKFFKTIDNSDIEKVSSDGEEVRNRRSGAVFEPPAYLGAIADSKDSSNSVQSKKNSPGKIKITAISPSNSSKKTFVLNSDDVKGRGDNNNTNTNNNNNINNNNNNNNNNEKNDNYNNNHNHNSLSMSQLTSYVNSKDCIEESKKFNNELHVDIKGDKDVVEGDNDLLVKSRRAAYDRIKDRKKDQEYEKTREVEETRRGNIVITRKWRNALKAKRKTRVEGRVDQEIIKDIIRNNPELLLPTVNRDESARVHQDDDSSVSSDDMGGISSLWGDLLEGVELKPYHRDQADYGSDGFSDYNGSNTKDFISKMRKIIGYLPPSEKSQIVDASGEKQIDQDFAGQNSMATKNLLQDYSSISDSDLALLDSDSTVLSYLKPLADFMYISGVDAETLQNYAYEAEKRFQSSSASSSGGSGPEKISFQHPAALLSITYVNLKEEIELNALPAFAFPSRVDICAQPFVQTRRRLSSASTPFSPSGSSYGNLFGNSGQDNTSDPKTSSRRLSMKFSSNLPPRKHVFLIVGHSILPRYSVCLFVQRTHYFPMQKVSLQVEYCISIVTQFPFISYFFNILEQFEASGGFEVEYGLHKQDVGYPAVQELQRFGDVAFRLRKFGVPFYNALSQESEQLDVHIVKKHAPINFRVVSSSANRAPIELAFNRDFFQKFYGKMPLVDSISYNILKPTCAILNEQFRESTFHILMWALPILLQSMHVSDIVFILGCITTFETYIIVQCSDQMVTSATIMAFMSLIMPLQYCGVKVVSLPPSLTDDLLDSPIPIIVGMQTMPESFKQRAKQIIVRPADGVIVKTGEVELHTQDISASNSWQLPLSSQLIKSLKQPAMNIVQYSKRRKTGLKPRTGSENENALVQTPLELDVNNTDCTQLLDAVAQFSNLISTHIQMIVNTVDRKSSIEAKLKDDYLKNAKLNSNPNPKDVINKYKEDVIGEKEKSKQIMMSRATPRRYSNSRSTKSSLNLNASLDDDAVSEAASIVSTASVIKDEFTNVLPSLDQGALKFLDKFAQTQLFAQYAKNREDLDEQSSKRVKLTNANVNVHQAKLMDSNDQGTKMTAVGTTKSSIDGNTKDASAIKTNVAGSENAGSTTPQQPVTKQQVSSSGGKSAKADSSRRQKGYSFDHFVELFQIMLTGTVALKQSELDFLKQSHIDKLKPRSHCGDDDEISRLGIGLVNVAINNESKSRSTSPMVSERSDGSNLGIASKATRKRTTSKEKVGDEPIKTQADVLLWCNGRCEGKANTPLCTIICLNKWQDQTKLVCKQLAIKSMITRQKNSNLVGDTMIRVKVNSLDQDQDLVAAGHDSRDRGKERLIPLKPRARVIKHPKETMSQYNKRVSDILFSEALNFESSRAHAPSISAPLSLSSTSASVASLVDVYSSFKRNNELSLTSDNSGSVGDNTTANESLSEEELRELIRHGCNLQSRGKLVEAQVSIERALGECERVTSCSRNHSNTLYSIPNVDRPHRLKPSKSATQSISNYYAIVKKNKKNRVYILAINVLKPFLLRLVLRRRFLRLRWAAYVIKNFFISFFDRNRLVSPLTRTSFNVSTSSKDTRPNSTADPAMSPFVVGGSGVASFSSSISSEEDTHYIGARAVLTNMMNSAAKSNSTNVAFVRTNSSGGDDIISNSRLTSNASAQNSAYIIGGQKGSVSTNSDIQESGSLVLKAKSSVDPGAKLSKLFGSVNDNITDTDSAISPQSVRNNIISKNNNDDTTRSHSPKAITTHAHSKTIEPTESVMLQPNHGSPFASMRDPSSYDIATPPRRNNGDGYGTERVLAESNGETRAITPIIEGDAVEREQLRRRNYEDKAATQDEIERIKKEKPKTNRIVEDNRIAALDPKNAVDDRMRSKDRDNISPLHRNSSKDSSEAVLVQPGDKWKSSTNSNINANVVSSVNPNAPNDRKPPNNAEDVVKNPFAPILTKTGTTESAVDTKVVAVGITLSSADQQMTSKFKSGRSESKPEINPESSLSGKFVKQGSFFPDALYSKEELWALKHLGQESVEMLNHHQLHAIYKMYDLLLKGSEVTKFSRQGKWSQRFIYCDKSFTKLFWRSKRDVSFSSSSLSPSSSGGPSDFEASGADPAPGIADLSPFNLTHISQSVPFSDAGASKYDDYKSGTEKTSSSNNLFDTTSGENAAALPSAGVKNSKTRRSSIFGSLFGGDKEEETKPPVIGTDTNSTENNHSLAGGGTAKAPKARRSSFFNFGRDKSEDEDGGSGGVLSFFSRDSRGGDSKNTMNSTDDDDASVSSSKADDVPHGNSRRKSWFVENLVSKPDADREVIIKDIIDVRDDYGTETIQKVLRRANPTVCYISPANEGLGLTKILSVIMKDSTRTFDFEIREQTFDVIFHALVTVLNYYKEVDDLRLTEQDIDAGAGGGGALQSKNLQQRGGGNEKPDRSQRIETGIHPV